MIKIAEGINSKVFAIQGKCVKKYKTVIAANQEINILRKCKNLPHIIQELGIQENQIVLPLMIIIIH